MKTSRTILQAVAMTVVAAFMLVVGLASAGNAADSTTTGYSDGVTYQGELNWGAPSDLHIAENGDACIDPPVWVWLTLHVEVNGVESADLTQVYPYEHNAPGYVCVPFPLPECPTDDDDPQDITWAAYGTWNIGSGRSNEIGGTIDCTPEIPAPPVVDPPAAPPVELAPPIVPAVAVPVEGETPTVEGELPVTGSMTTPLVGIASVLAGIGYSLHRFTKAARTKIAG